MKSVSDSGYSHSFFEWHTMASNNMGNLLIVVVFGNDDVGKCDDVLPIESLSDDEEFAWSVF
jgi:hypothetical protein